MTREEAHRILECMAINLTWALPGTKEPMLDVLRQRLGAINIAQAALRPVSREQVEKVWRGEWNYIHKTKIDGFDVVQCSKCGQEALKLALYVKNGNFCPYCGAPMTDEAVEMVMERMEKIK